MGNIQEIGCNGEFDRFCLRKTKLNQEPCFEITFTLAGNPLQKYGLYICFDDDQDEVYRDQISMHRYNMLLFHHDDFNIHFTLEKNKITIHYEVSYKKKVTIKYPLDFFIPKEST